MASKLIEFPRVERPGFRPAPQSPEAIIAELAPTIQCEADMQHLLSQVEPDKRDAIEKCLRAAGACAQPETPPC